MPVDAHLLASFLVLSAVLSAVPGPSVVLSTGRAITDGRTPGLRIVAGNFLGGLVLVTCVIAGLGAVVAASVTVFTVVKSLGVVYLVWLGGRALWSAWRGDVGDLGDVSRPGRDSALRQVREGFLVGVSNPKSLVALTAILPQFVDPGRGSIALQLAVVGLSGAVAQVLIESTWVLAAVRLRAWFLARRRRLRALQGAGGVAMIGLAGRVALQRPAG